MEGDRRVEADPYFELESLSASPVVPEGLAAISHARARWEAASRRTHSVSSCRSCCDSRASRSCSGTHNAKTRGAESPFCPSVGDCEERGEGMGRVGSFR